METEVTDIGFHLGFPSQGGFARLFFANGGMGPTQYRRVVNVHWLRSDEKRSHAVD
jgi:AraC-like DNA-binding protein